MEDREKLSRLIETARGEAPANLLITNARVVNVFTGEIYKTGVAALGDKIAGVGDFYRDGKTVLDAEGKYVLPGLMDAHIHIESSLLAPWEFARLVLRRGTAAVIADPHEIVNVAGVRGFEFMLKAAESLPLDFYFMVPSCVPATALETSGAKLGAGQVKRLLKKKNVLGLAEMMNFPGVISGDESTLEKIAAARASGKFLDGHAPGLSGADLQAYIACGVDTDHECVSAGEAIGKLRAGMRVMIREGTVEKNLADLVPAINEKNIHRVLFVSDDKSPLDLLRHGHLDDTLRKAVRAGLDAASAVRMVTFNPASFYGLRRRGAIAPGYAADMVIVEDLENFKVDKVIKSGALVVDGGEAVLDIPGHHDGFITSRMNVKRLSEESFRVEDRGERVRVIEAVPGQIITGHGLARLSSENGALLADTGRDILKIAVMERHKGTGNIGLGFVRGLGLSEGAIASSVAHDSHNIVVAGADDRSMLTAAREIEKLGGGLAAAVGGEIKDVLPLPIAGLMSAEPAETVVEKLERLLYETRLMGSKAENPFSVISFLALAVIPHLKITDKGLVDVDRMGFVSVYEDS
ncbi:MAG: adenine deaminase [Candidatus Nitrospinota bacterium M3_3B_026]